MGFDEILVEYIIDFSRLIPNPKFILIKLILIDPFWQIKIKKISQNFDYMLKRLRE